jgi:uncharacterized protein YcbK (DUF882 family)
MNGQKLTKSFYRVELASPDDHSCNMRPEFMEALQALRDEFGKPMIITSGYRTRAHNTKIGGSPNSQHMLGAAADVAITSPYDRYEFIRLAIKHGFTGIGIAPTFIHLDRRNTTPLIFDYSSTPKKKGLT